MKTSMQSWKRSTSVHHTAFLNGRREIYLATKLAFLRNPLLLITLAISACGGRGLPTVRMAEVEFEKWKEVLFKIVGSLHVES